MLDWMKTAPNAFVAQIKGYTFAITEDEDDEEWGVKVTSPDANVDYQVCGTLEEAKELCENSAREIES